MRVVDKFYTGYSERPPMEDMIEERGEELFTTDYPKLAWIRSITALPDHQSLHGSGHDYHKLADQQSESQNEREEIQELSDARSSTAFLWLGILFSCFPCGGGLYYGYKMFKASQDKQVGELRRMRNEKRTKEAYQQAIGKQAGPLE